MITIRTELPRPPESAGEGYRLIASFDFCRQTVFVMFLGTHAEYDAVNALTVTMF
jgi:mRNA interferase HigB